MQLLFLLLSVTFWLLGRGEKNSGVEKVGCLAIVLWLQFLAGKKGIAFAPHECAECVVRFLRCLSIRCRSAAGSALSPRPWLSTLALLSCSTRLPSGWVLQQAERVLGNRCNALWNAEFAACLSKVVCLSKTPPCMTAECVPAVPVQLAGDPVPEAVPRPQAGEQFPMITVVCAAALW
jgi:hypothetical protein